MVRMASKAAPTRRARTYRPWRPWLRQWARLPASLRRVASAVIWAFRGFYQDGCSTHAAAIAYYAIFSLVPLALIILSVCGLVVDRNQIVDLVFEQVPLRETESVRNNVQQIVDRAQDASIAGLGFGIIGLVWSSTGIFGAVRSGLNATRHTKPRAFWRGKLVDIAVIPVFGILIALSVSVSGAIQVVVERTGRVGPVSAIQAWQLISLGVAAGVSFILFTGLYRFVPNQGTPWSEALTSAAFATIAFEATKLLYGLLIGLLPFTTDTAIYAGFGTALAFLLWMYINASIVLLGAEFGRALRGGRTTDVAAESFLKPFGRGVGGVDRKHRRL